MVRKYRLPEPLCPVTRERVPPDRAMCLSVELRLNAVTYIVGNARDLTALKDGEVAEQDNDDRCQQEQKPAPAFGPDSDGGHRKGESSHSERSTMVRLLEDLVT
jgi:hypothetical protein